MLAAVCEVRLHPASVQEQLRFASSEGEGVSVETSEDLCQGTEREWVALEIESE